MEEEIGEEKAEDEIEATPQWILSLVHQEPVYESPIDINISKTIQIELPPLEWHHYDLPPKKMKMTNTGYTLIVSAKWQQERPYITEGPLLGNYVFSQLHFHWGKNDAEGSEHTMDGVRHPMEMHAIFFKANYLTQEAAMKEQDGIVVLAFIYKLQSGTNSAVQILLDNIFEVQNAHTSFKMHPAVPLSTFLKKFEKDYFLYWGSVSTTICVHHLLWFISREPVGISTEQVELFRSLCDENEEPMEENFREVHPLNGRRVFHVCPSKSQMATLLALP